MTQRLTKQQFLFKVCTPPHTHTHTYGLLPTGPFKASDHLGSMTHPLCISHIFLLADRTSVFTTLAMRIDDAVQELLSCEQINASIGA